MNSKNNTYVIKKVISAKRAFMLLAILTAMDVITTIIAIHLIPSAFESNKYVLMLINIFGFYLGLLVYFLIFFISGYIFLFYYKKHVCINVMYYRVINVIGLCALWGLAFTRFMPVINNLSYIVGFLISPYLLHTSLFFIFGVMFGVFELIRHRT